MAEIAPPRQNVPVFNPKYFIFLGANIGGEYLDANYLKFPVSQYARQTFNSGIYLANSSNITFTDGTTQATAATSSATPNIADVLTAGNDATGLEIDNFIADGATALTTPSPNSNDLKLATTAYTDVALTNYETSTDIASTYLTIVDAGTTYETITNANLLAPKASPALTGTPTTTTASLGDNSSRIASTAFVQNEIATIPTPSTFTGQGATYNMPFSASKVSNGTGGSSLDVFQLKMLQPTTWKGTDLIVLKVNMFHLTTFNDTTAPYAIVSSTYAGGFTGIWVFNPKNCCNPALAGTTPISTTTPNTGNPISGGTGEGTGVYDTSDTPNNDFFYAPVNTNTGSWGSGSTNGTVSFNMSVNASSEATFIFRYLTVNQLGITSNRNQRICGSIEVVGISNNGGATDAFVMKTYSGQGGNTYPEIPLEITTV